MRSLGSLLMLWGAMSLVGLCAWLYDFMDIYRRENIRIEAEIRTGSSREEANNRSQERFYKAIKGKALGQFGFFMVLFFGFLFVVTLVVYLTRW